MRVPGGDGVCICRVQLVAGARLLSTIGFMFSDVTTDAILVERSKREPRERRGSMQAIGYSVRFAGRWVDHCRIFPVCSASHP